MITFVLPAGAPEPPMGAVQVDGAFRVETFSLQEDLYRLLGWAHDAGVDFRELESGPTRLDDVFRAITGG
ncbi:hypothetical protein [Streptomyces sp. IB2014 016-6]|uniref:hypothetical protein n=1 Tax=Streptomyces sp. IB2014 016-6 TaxID=2517818 RepID=UPI001F4F2328|nr:hypothetical protein [Streptomyces sp. IB2014 016-6]